MVAGATGSIITAPSGVRPSRDVEPSPRSACALSAASRFTDSDSEPEVAVCVSALLPEAAALAPCAWDSPAMPRTASTEASDSVSVSASASTLNSESSSPPSPVPLGEVLMPTASEPPRAPPAFGWPKAIARMSTAPCGSVTAEKPSPELSV